MINVGRRREARRVLGPRAGLLAAEGYGGVYARGAPRGNITGQERDCAQSQRNQRERQRIVRAHAVPPFNSKRNYEVWAGFADTTK